MQPAFLISKDFHTSNRCRFILEMFFLVGLVEVRLLGQLIGLEWSTGMGESLMTD